MSWVTLLLLAALMTSARAEPYSGTYGYRQISGGGVYKVHRETATWKNAWRACSEEDAHLAIIETHDEAEMLRRLLRDNRLRSRGAEPGIILENTFFVSVGFHSLYSDRFWTTVFGEPLDQYYNAWARGRPSNFGSVSQCGAVNLNLELVDIPCEGKEYPFVCERIVH